MEAVFSGEDVAVGHHGEDVGDELERDQLVWKRSLIELTNTVLGRRLDQPLRWRGCSDERKRWLSVSA